MGNLGAGLPTVQVIRGDDGGGGRNLGQMIPGCGSATLLLSSLFCFVWVSL